MPTVITVTKLRKFATDVNNWDEDRLSFLMNAVSAYIPNKQDQEALMAKLRKYKKDNPRPDWKSLLK